MSRRGPVKKRQSRKSPISRGSIGICILAGGLSSRMGRSKAAVRLGGVTLLQHVTRTARKSGLPARIIRRDLVSRCGPLGGIYTGLFTTAARAELFLACDMPFVSLALIAEVAERFRKTGKPVFTRAGRRSGFPCLLPRVCAEAVHRFLTAGEYSLQSLASELGASFVAIRRGELDQVLNINTPADLETARQKLDKLGA